LRLASLLWEPGRSGCEHSRRTGIKAISRRGGGGIHALGYQEEFEEEDVYAIDPVPSIKFDTKSKIGPA
jgi:hypothetical protein